MQSPELLNKLRKQNIFKNQNQNFSSVVISILIIILKVTTDIAV
jgi:hypothetical protein